MVTTLSAGAMPLNEIVMDDRHGILVVGNEADGVDQSIQDIASDCITIPMKLGTDSLNVSVAAAIVMYHLTTQLP